MYKRGFAGLHSVRLTGCPINFLIFQKYWQQIAQSHIIRKEEKKLTFSLDKQNDIFQALIFEKLNINFWKFSPPLNHHEIDSSCF